MKKVILSYDYELFFGEKSGTVIKSLIEPTNAILDTLDSVNAKGNFFVDWQMLKYLKAQNTKQTDFDYILIVNQLKDIVRRGHRIELHIHPHWVDAKYNGDGTWDFSDFRHYSLNRFSEKDIVDMFVEGTNLLTNIARTVDPEYKIIAFRAGGWAVQPFGCLRTAFKEVGIKIDSSVALGVYGNNQYSSFDFRNVITTSKDFYQFDVDVAQENKDGEFIEVPISSYKRNLIYKIIDKVFRTLFKTSKMISDGTHYRSDLLNVEKPTRSMVTLSRISPLSTILSLLSQNTSIITIIDHPKDFTPSSLLNIKIINRLYKIILYKDLL